MFVEHPEVPMDNNTAERAQRGPVVGRKNYYGSGSVWSGRLAAMTFSLFQTLCLWRLNPRLWLTAYLEACAKAGGRADRMWTGSCHGTSAESKDGRWGATKRSRRRTPHRNVPWSCPDRLQSQTHGQPEKCPGGGTHDR